MPLFIGFQHHPRWLFGISEPSTVFSGDFMISIPPPQKDSSPHYSAGKASNIIAQITQMRYLGIPDPVWKVSWICALLSTPRPVGQLS